MQTQVMAILNLTPDSFSDGGRLRSLDQVLAEAEKALALGVDVLDVGGESTRPGAQAISIEEECRRIIPATQALHQTFPQACISVDTRKAAVARSALEAGAQMVNDVSGLQFDPEMPQVVAAFEASLVIMHSQGTPETMQENPVYEDVVAEVSAFLQQQAQVAMAAGVRAERIWLDPGFGFGKRLEHNLALLQGLDQIVALGFPVLVGTSRKSFLTLGDSSILPSQREALTSASLVLAIERGVAMVRIHDPVIQVPVVRFVEAGLETH